MNLKDMIKGKDLVLSQRHERWLEENANPVYSEKALQFAQDVLSQDVGGSRSRSSSFRASALGSCGRRQVYKAMDTKGDTKIDAKLANIFATGNFLHLKWQMMGLTEGWLVEAEIPAESDTYDFGGTLDGILYDGSLFEFKSINDRGFRNVNEYGPKKDHILQAHGYMWLKDLEAVSFVYENKGDGEWREFRVKRDESTIDQIKDSTSKLELHLTNETIPDPLQSCIEKQGYLYRQCPYRKVCLEH